LGLSYLVTGVCPSGCSGHGTCTANGVCDCELGYTGTDCSTAGCDEQCSLHGGVCDNGVCEFRCSDYAGYTCQNSSALIPSLALCGDVLAGEAKGQHCAPSESSILQQLEAAVVVPNYNRLIPSGRPFFSMFDNGYCSAAAKRLACWISIQRCDMDGDNRLRVCQSACQSYNKACGARLDCSDRTLFSGEEGYGSGTCTGDGTTEARLQLHLRILLLAGLLIAITGFFLATIRYICQTLQTSGSGVMGDSMHNLHGPYVVITEGEFEGGWSGTGRRKPLGTFCSLPMEPLLSLFMHKTSRLPSRHLLSDILLMHTQQLHPHRATRGVESMSEEGN
jgi:leishmanolysin